MPHQKVQMDPKSQYQKRLKDGDLKPDPAQAHGVESLQRLYAELLEYKPRKGWFSKAVEPPRGVYFYAGVGRGKSMLMDLFQECLPDSIPVRRVHFHEFMISVHDYIHSRRSDDSIRQGADESIPLFAARLAEKTRVLCFDEFHVTDIADAMILGRLYRCLFERGVVIVSTSNWDPDDLYKDGLQRDRFFPFIEMIKQKMEVFHLDSPHDYRVQFLVNEGSYFHPLSTAKPHMDLVFDTLTDGRVTREEVLTVKGREIPVPVTVKGIARFNFSELFEQPLGAEDYLKISETYHTVFLEGAPKMGSDRRNEIKRLMNFIDVLYEGKNRLVMSADAPPEELYCGDDHSFEFERTISRLNEMQSLEYIQKIRKL